MAVFVATALATLLWAGGTVGASPPDYPPAPTIVAGHIYLDTNGNGTQDPGEPDLSGVEVQVTDSTNTTQTVTTDANGNWTADVAPGTVTADVDEATLPPGVLQTEGTDPTVVNAVEGAITDAGNDGYVPSGTVSGHIYLDTNGNGTQDPGEPDLPGIELTITDSSGETQTVTTDEDGMWSASVRPGTTTIDIDETTVPADLTITEGSDVTTVTAISNQNVDVGNVGYTRRGGDIPKSGTDSTLGGVRLGIGLVALGAGLVAVTRLRRRQPAHA